jgi:hypothetical protein
MRFMVTLQENYTKDKAVDQFRVLNIKEFQVIICSQPSVVRALKCTGIRCIKNVYRTGRSQWPRCLRRRSTAARLLRSRVRIPPWTWMFSVVCVVCCQVEVSATSWSLVHRSLTDCGASLCVIKKPRERGGHSPRWAAQSQEAIARAGLQSQR